MKKVLIILLVIIIYVFLSFSINNSVSFEVQPDICKMDFCVIGAPLYFDLKLKNNTQGEICIISKSLNQVERISLNRSFEILNKSLGTNKNLVEGKNYDIIFTRCKRATLPIWLQDILNKILDPLSYSKSKNSYNFRYPKIELICGEYSKSDEGILFKQITLKNNENINWKCKIRINVSEGAKIEHEDFKRISIDSGYRDIFDSSYEDITKGGDSYGRDDVKVVSDSCKNEIVIELNPICLINGVEIKIPQDKSNNIIKEKLPKNKC